MSHDGSIVACSANVTFTPWRPRIRLYAEIGKVIGGAWRRSIDPDSSLLSSVSGLL